MESLRTYAKGIALITGAGSGLGRALAVELARRGASLHLSDLDSKGLEQTAALVGSAGGDVQTDCVDVRDAAAVRQWVLAPPRVDYLFNNAGIAGVGGLTDRYAPSDWETIIDVNLNGVVNGVHAAYSVMVRQGFGHIVNTASLAGLTPFPLVLPYSAVKHAVVGLSKSLRIEAATKGVRVSVLCPGAIRTPILTSVGMRGEEQVSAERVLKWWEQFKPIDPEPWARETLDRVARNEAVIIVPRTARIVAAFFQWLPRQAEQAARRDLARTLELFPELEQAPSVGEAESDWRKAA
jgi:NAD(P)-dependent dehydrogenase (short-subunit alcohol dehydrogenase family)